MRHAHPGPHHTLGHYSDSQEELFEAALETIRTLPGWEVLTAHPEEGEIRARARGRIFTPTREHILHLKSDPDGTGLSVESIRARTQDPEDDPHVMDLFRTLLEDHLQATRKH
jgi:hypothetical protein